MLQQVLDTIREERMLLPGDLVLVGVSGGADSVCLLHLLTRLQKELGLAGLVCCHLHHGIRGAEADRDRDFVKTFCSQLHIPFFTEQRDIPALSRKLGESEELCGRNQRYAFFADTLTAVLSHAGLLPEQGKIATAHTLSDQEETLFLNLIRGTGLKGLCGIPPMRENVVRPLIRCTRQQVEDYCSANSLSYMEDSTNREDLYFRNRLRHQLLPVLHDLSPTFDQSVLRLTDSLRADAEALDRMAESALEQAKWQPFSPQEPAYSRSALAALPEALLRRCCTKLIALGSGQPDYGKILLLQKAVLQGGGLEVTTGTKVMVTEKKVLLRTCKEKPPAPEPVPLLLERVTRLGEKKLVCALFSKKNTKNSKNIWESPLKNQLDYDRIAGGLVLRTRQPGDRISLPGRNGSKTLKKLFWEHQVPEPERDRLLVLADDLGVCWVEGFGCDSRTAVTAETEQVLLLSPGREP